MRPADLPLDRQHRAGPVLLWDAFAVLTEVTVLYRRTGRRRRRLWTWGEHLPPPSVVRNSNMEGQLWVQRPPRSTLNWYRRRFLLIKGFDISSKSNFCLTKETDEHNLFDRYQMHQDPGA